MDRHKLTWLAVLAIITSMFVKLPPMVAQQDAVLSTYRALVEVDALAKKHYAEPIADQTLVEGAIRGMMAQLDPYSGYVAADELATFERNSSGEYDGVGLEVDRRGGHAVVIAPFEGSPAEQAGILAGDVILAINGEPVEGISSFEIGRRLAGPVGSAVELLLERAGRREPQRVHITRGHVSARTVRGFRRLADGEWDYLIDPQHKFGYVRVSSFRRHTAEEFDAALAGLEALGARGLVLDLRFNPGGLMDQAIAMADQFLASGLVLSTVTRFQSVLEYRAEPGEALPRAPLVVLVNRASASSAEIVAGALQDHGRAVVVGERTFGKGSVQHLIRLERLDAAIKLTVAYYRLPGGRLIHRTAQASAEDTWGIVPDVTVPLGEEEMRAIQQSRQASMEGAPESPFPPGGEPVAHDSTVRTAGREIMRDRQLLEALLLLRERIALSHNDPS